MVRGLHYSFDHVWRLSTHMRTYYINIIRLLLLTRQYFMIKVINIL